MSGSGNLDKFSNNRPALSSKFLIKVKKKSFLFFFLLLHILKFELTPKNIELQVKGFFLLKKISLSKNLDDLYLRLFVSKRDGAITCSFGKNVRLIFSQCFHWE